MEVYKDAQYNQGVGKYKILSSNAGVGSIITTKAGFFIMPQSVSMWGLVKNVNKQIENFDEKDPEEIAKRAGVDVINDSRFIKFLKQDQGIINLLILVDIPHLSLTGWNFPKVKEHPLYKKYQELNGAELPVEHFVIPAIHFPRWFYSSKKQLFKPIEEWKTLWKEHRCNNGDLKYFAPPRDAFSKTNRTFKDEGKEQSVYETLVQIPILLICKNGHISDIPWYQLFCSGLDGKKKELSNGNGMDLFDYVLSDCEVGGRHELQWIENRNSSESWGTLKCKKCKKAHSLEGIMNIRPYCKGETPWNGIGTMSEHKCMDSNGKRSVMQMALATSNSVYYADSFSSLFIPSSYLQGILLPKNQQKVLDLLNDKWYPKAKGSNPSITKSDYWNSINIIDKADDSDIVVSDNDANNIKSFFLKEIEKPNDSHEQYRFDEYNIFSNNSKSISDSKNLEFKDILLPDCLTQYFKKIQQVDKLALTSTQLGFSRVSLPTPKRKDGIVFREEGQHIYNDSIDKVYTLPAHQTIGEGIFFEFDLNKVKEWSNTHEGIFNKRYNQPEGELGKSLKEEMTQYSAPVFYLLHTFSHIILKELEFSCGYPTASLQERLYYSDRMCGVLIFTTDGAEGSMGGLVWQGQPRLISRIIKSAVNRAEQCASDPLCWENEDLLNLSACFSCCFVSETTCEKRNLGLDRRALIDSDFGFFKQLLL